MKIEVVTGGSFGFFLVLLGIAACIWAYSKHKSD